jgi:hypothetical protein
MTETDPDVITGKPDALIRQEVYVRLGPLASTLNPVEHGTLSYVVGARSRARIARFVEEVRAKRGEAGPTECDICGAQSSRNYCPRCELEDHLAIKEANR